MSGMNGLEPMNSALDTSQFRFEKEFGKHNQTKIEKINKMNNWYRVWMNKEN
jgi:hypothetical protein